jgi:hypothetical protein
LPRTGPLPLATKGCQHTFSGLDALHCPLEQHQAVGVDDVGAQDVTHGADLLQTGGGLANGQRHVTGSDAGVGVWNGGERERYG